MEAIVDGGRGAVDRWRVLPPAAGLQDMNDAAEHAAIVHPSGARLIGRQQWLDRRPLVIAEEELQGHDGCSADIQRESHC